jgi:hypothetical protein
MKPSARLLLLVLAGLSLAGCTSQTAAVKPAAKPLSVAFGDQPLTSRDYWLHREFDDRIDRAIGVASAGPSTSTR